MISAAKTPIDFAGVVDCKKTYFSLFGMVDIIPLILNILDKNIYFDVSTITDKISNGKKYKNKITYCNKWFLFSYYGPIREVEDMHYKVHIHMCNKYYYENTCPGDYKQYAFFIRCRYFISAFKRPKLSATPSLEVAEGDIIAAEIYFDCECKYGPLCFHKFMLKDNVVQKINDMVDYMNKSLNSYNQ